MDIKIRPIAPEATHALRHAVLWPSVPLAAQAQDYDAPPTVHLGAFHGAALVGVLTLVPTGGRVQLRKFAVAAAWQGRGVGGALLAAAVREGGELVLDARVEQVPFYTKRGFAVLDPAVFTKRGPGGLGPPVEYVRMGKRPDP
jgi:GNAT superfamily N-acetyltransferase